MRNLLVLAGIATLGLTACPASDEPTDDPDDGAAMDTMVAASSSSGGLEESETGVSTTLPPETGGMDGDEGTTGTPGPAPEIVLMEYTFAEDLQGFEVRWAEVGTMGQDLELQTATILEHVPEGGYSVDATDTGAMQLSIPLTLPEQKIQFSAVMPMDMPIDMIGGRIRAQVRVVAGFDDPLNPGVAKLFIKTGTTFHWADGGANNIAFDAAAETWVGPTLSADTPSFINAPLEDYDPSQTLEIGMEIAAGSGAQTFLINPTVILIDSIQILGPDPSF